MSRGGGSFRGRGRGGGAGRGGAQGGALLTGTAVNPDFIPDFFNTSTKLFPEIHLQVPQDNLISEKYYNIRYRKLVRNLSKSAFYIVEGVQDTDIERYSDRFITSQTNKGSLTDIPVDFKFIPEELHSVSNPAKRKKVQKNLGVSQINQNLIDQVFNSALEDTDVNGGLEGGQLDGKNNEDNDDDEVDEDHDQYDDELDEANDYEQNYFSDGDNDYFDDYDNDDY